MTVILSIPIFGPVLFSPEYLGNKLLLVDGKSAPFDSYLLKHGSQSMLTIVQTAVASVSEVQRSSFSSPPRDMQQNDPHPDVLTLAGNGEPTVHPRFEII